MDFKGLSMYSDYGSIFKISRKSANKNYKSQKLSPIK